MDKNELKQLHELLEKFVTGFPEHKGSIYGRNMDVGVAKSAQNMLYAYGLNYDIEFFCIDGSTETMRGYMTRDAAVKSAEYYIAEENPGNHRLSYTIK